MIDEKKLANAAMNDEELNNVAGGTYIDSFNVGSFLYQAGFDGALNDKGLPSMDGIRSALDSIGVTANLRGGVAALGGTGNTYTVNATGETLDQAGMMSMLREKYPNVRFKGISEPQSLNELVGMIK